MPDVMVLINNTEDYPSWSLSAKIDRAKATVAWHDYIRDLYKKGKVTHLWGSHQLLSRATPSTSQGVLVAVYSTSTWKEFDDLLLHDPLRDTSTYLTTPLSSLLEDRDSDQARFDAHKEQFFGSSPSPYMLAEYESRRAMYNDAPDYVGKEEYRQPENKPTTLEDTFNEGDPLNILLLGVNPEEYISMWDDFTKLVHHEKVMWWHDYTSKMIAEKKVTHAWGTNDFCKIGETSGNSAAAVSIFSVSDYEEFDGLYKMDPIRQSTLFISVLLRPISDQLEYDKARLEVLEKRRS